MGCLAVETRSGDLRFPVLGNILLSVGRQVVISTNGVYYQLASYNI